MVGGREFKVGMKPFRIEGLLPKIIITFQRTILGDHLVIDIRINLQIFLKFPIMNRL